MIHCSAARTRSLLFLLFIAVSVFCCKKVDDEFIGRDILPSGDNLQFSEIDSLSIIAYTVKDDSVRTDERSISPLGTINDPAFGITSTAVYAQLRLPENNLDFSAVTIDSIVLTLKYNTTSTHFGNPGSQQTIKVHELTESLRMDSTYYSTSHAAYGAEIGSWTGTFNTTDSITIVQGSKTKRLPPQLRIPITSGAFRTKIQTAGANFGTSEAFLNYIKGVAIVPETAGVITGEGAIMNMALVSEYSNLTIYYNDSLSKDFVINENSPRFNSYYHNYSGTAIGPQLGMKQHRDTCYAQSMAGVKTLLRIPQLFDLVKKNKNKAVSILGAELSIPVYPSTNTTTYPYPLQMILVSVDSNGKNYSLGSSLLGYLGKYNTDKTEIKVNLTLHLQSILNAYRRTGLERDYGLYLVPSYNFAGMERIVLNTSASGAVRPRLKLIYNVIP